jgi:hypothetical protein
MPWIQPRDHADFYREVMSDRSMAALGDNSEIFRDLMMQQYGIKVTAGPVGDRRRFYLDDRNYILFLLRWS